MTFIDLEVIIDTTYTAAGLREISSLVLHSLILSVICSARTGQRVLLSLFSRKIQVQYRGNIFFFVMALMGSWLLLFTGKI